MLITKIQILKIYYSYTPELIPKSKNKYLTDKKDYEQNQLFNDFERILPTLNVLICTISKYKNKMNNTQKHLLYDQN